MPPSDGPATETAATEAESAELINLRRAVEDLRGQLGKFEARQRDGFAVDFHDFPYIPRYREWSAAPGLEPIRKLIAAGESSYLQLFERFCGLDAKFREIPVLPAQAGPREPYWENWWLPGYDAVMLYGL